MKRPAQQGADDGTIPRRTFLTSLGLAALAGLRSVQGQSTLPLRTTGLEHLGLTVPDPEAAARFYGRIFDPQLFQERDPPPRFYVRLGTAYLAFGRNPDVPPFIDHVCALVEEYRAQETRKELESAGITMGTGPGGMALDPDGLRLQLLGVPGGLARTIMPATRISQDDALVQAVGPEHVMLRVMDLDRSVAHYRKIFGPEIERSSRRAWFKVARTRLGLEPVGSGEKPSIHHLAVRVAGLDRARLADRLRGAGIDTVRMSDVDAVALRDPNGLVVALLPERRT